MEQTVWQLMLGKKLHDPDVLPRFYKACRGILRWARWIQFISSDVDITLAPRACLHGWVSQAVLSPPGSLTGMLWAYRVRLTVYTWFHEQIKLRSLSFGLLEPSVTNIFLHSNILSTLFSGTPELIGWDEVVNPYSVRQNSAFMLFISFGWVLENRSCRIEW
jgi:hypothetical protein